MLQLTQLVLTEPLSGMTAAELTAFIQNFVADYAQNADMTRLPNRMVIPMTDWLGLDRPYSSDYPMISLREYLVKAFKQSTMREDAEIFLLLMLMLHTTKNLST